MGFEVSENFLDKLIDSSTKIILADKQRNQVNANTNAESLSNIDTKGKQEKIGSPETTAPTAGYSPWMLVGGGLLALGAVALVVKLVK